MTNAVPTPDRSVIDELRSAYAHCFGCGLENPNGLQLNGFSVDGDSVTAPFAPDPTFAGFEGVLHGGIVATALDEISAWAAMLTHGVFVFTAKIDVRYRRQAPSEAVFTLKGTVTERRGKRLTIHSELAHERHLVAHAEGLFVVARSISPEETAS